MRTLTIAVLGAALHAMPAVAAALTPTNALQPTPEQRAVEPDTARPDVIVTAGDGIVRRGPDVAFLVIAVETRAKSPRDAQRQNADAAAAVSRRIAEAGIPRDAVRTIGIDLQQEFDFNQGRRVPREYLARNTIEVRVDDVAKAGETLDAAVQAGATSTSGVRFDLRDRASAEREAVRIAVVDARARAEAAAAGAGRAIGRILKIEEGGEGPIVMPRQRIEMAAAPATAATPVEPGLIEVRAHVTLTVSMR